MTRIKIKKVMGHKRWDTIEVVEGSKEHKEIILWNRAMNYSIHQNRKELERMNLQAEMEVSAELMFEESGFEFQDNSPTPSELYIRELEHQELKVAIKQLTERQQEMVRFIFWEGKSQVEVAEFYHITEAAVSRAMERIYATLRKILGKK